MPQMKSGFSHFDDCRRENFCASVLLLAMEADEETKRLVVDAVCRELGIHEPVTVVAMGREARLATSASDGSRVRTDIWLQLRDSKRHFHVLVELKTHDRWHVNAIADQVRQQAARKKLARSRHEIGGCVLLAPSHLCARVRQSSSPVPTLEWSALLSGMKRIAKPSSVTEYAIKHLEKYVERPIGIENRTLADFETASTTVGCLRAFLRACIADIGGKETAKFYITDNSEPIRRGGWAHFGISVVFKFEKVEYRLGIYKYVEAPPGEEESLEHPWLEALHNGTHDLVEYLPFNPQSLAPGELDKFRVSFREAWESRKGSSGVGKK